MFFDYRIIAELRDACKGARSIDAFSAAGYTFGRMAISSPSGQPLFSREYLARLILPLVAEQFLAMTIGACDTLMVSSIGEAGVSGVSLVDQFSQLMIQLFAAFATGGAVVSSQYLGHKDARDACVAAKQLLNLALISGLLIIAVFVPLRAQILTKMYGRSEADVLQSAITYFFWVGLSFPFLAVYSSCAALFRSMGNSKLSLKVSILMNLTNIGGNAALIYGAKIGVSGAGIATLASRVVAAVVMVVLLCDRKRNVIHFDNIFRPEWNGSMVRRILRVGIPSGIENSVFHIGKLVVQVFMSGFGTAAIAANAICNTVASFANIPGNAIGMASVTVVGQCIGAGEKGQAKRYARVLLRETYVAMSLLALLILLFAPQVVSLFNISDEAKRLAAGVIRTCMVGNALIWPLAFTLPNSLRAAGDVKFTMMVSNISMWLFRVLFSYAIATWILRRNPDSTSLALYGVWFGMYIDWLFRSACYVVRFRHGRWLDKRVI